MGLDRRTCPMNHFTLRKFRQQIFEIAERVGLITLHGICYSKLCVCLRMIKPPKQTHIITEMR